MKNLCPKCRKKRKIVTTWADESLHGGPCPACRGTGERWREFPLWAWWLLAILLLAILRWLTGRPEPRPLVRRGVWIVPAGGTLWEKTALAGNRDPRLWMQEVGRLNGWDRPPLLHAGEEVMLPDWRKRK